jgi:hypothetical protein
MKMELNKLNHYFSRLVLIAERFLGQAANLPWLPMKQSRLQADKIRQLALEVRQMRTEIRESSLDVAERYGRLRSTKRTESECGPTDE